VRIRNNDDDDDDDDDDNDDHDDDDDDDAAALSCSCRRYAISSRNCSSSLLSSALSSHFRLAARALPSGLTTKMPWRKERENKNRKGKK
jgi:hypothetical protein